jgi:ATP-dependent helicase/nuclease subunit A
VLQFCDFELLKSEGAKSELDRLVQSEFLSQKDAERVRLNELERFTRSELYAEMVSAKKLHRELRFNVKLPASIFTSDGEKKKELSSRSVLVQGVIDCIIEHEDGSLHLIDYKTDRLTKEELSNISLAEKKLRESHSLQLSYYAEAIFRMFGRYPYKIGVYSMHLGKEVEIDKSLEM